MTRQEELAHQGWQRQATYDDPDYPKWLTCIETSAWKFIWSLFMLMKNRAAPVA